MDLRWNIVGRDSFRDVRIWLHPTKSIPQVRREIISSPPVSPPNSPPDDELDLTDFVTAATHSMFDCSITLNWNVELFGNKQPRPNQILEIRLLQNGTFQTLWIGIIESISGLTMSRGERSMTITARSRDCQELWRGTKRITPLFPQLTDMTYIARRIAESAGLEPDEILLPASAFTTPHTNTQLADISAWDMLTTVFLPMGGTPFIDCLGRLKIASRQLQGRTPDIIVAEDRVVRVIAQRQRPPATRVRLRWLNPTLTKALQQGRKLADKTMTTGWFIPYLKHDIWFSEDKTQRAIDTYMVIRQSANALIVPVCQEKYEQLAQNEGKITLINWAFAPAIVALATSWYVAHNVPDEVQTDVVTGTGVTIPTGRRVEAIAQLAFMLIVLSIGTGIYEIWGTPYEWVHARNTTEAFDSSAPIWIDNGVDVDSDFIINEAHAQAVAVTELIFQAWSANKWSVVLVDDPRIEMGHILEFPDGSKIYVTDYHRQLMRGSEATLQVEGFMLGGKIVSGTPTATILPPPPVIPPSGSDGPGAGGPGVGEVVVNMGGRSITIENSPNVSAWPETTAITRLELKENVYVTFNKQDGAGKWPDVTPPGWGGPLQYTLWIIFQVAGTWYGSGIIQYWHGLGGAGGNVTLANQIATNWVYSSRWGPMQGHQPAAGDQVGFMVSAGNARGQDDHLVMERSSILWITWPASTPATFP